MWSFLLKSWSESRYRRVSEESAAINSDMRADRGGDVGVDGSGSGFSRTSALARLHELAPRSRTLGKCRLMSYLETRGEPFVSNCSSLSNEGVLKTVVHRTSSRSETRTATSSFR